jgi:hypothetical protein
MIEEALELFKGKFPFKKRVNCAVAIGTTFNKVCPITETTLKNMDKMGHGRAPGKTCGAYHAALEVVNNNNPEMADNLTKYFTEQAGSTICREIKKRRFSCEDCVRVAAEFLHENCPNAAELKK